jgi:transcriptional regulator with XRE-family HTH domain
MTNKLKIVSNTQSWFRENLRAQMHNQGLNNKQLSQLSGVSNSFLGQFLNQADNISLKIMTALSDTLGVPLADMLRNPADFPTPPAGFCRLTVVVHNIHKNQILAWAKQAEMQIDPGN